VQRTFTFGIKELTREKVEVEPDLNVVHRANVVSNRNAAKFHVAPVTRKLAFEEKRRFEHAPNECLVSKEPIFC
jgi:hypothetical protein